ncbi:hypothetical protein Tco_1525401 [Tanacetum coccineum]
MPSVEPALPVSLTTKPASSDEQHRASVESEENGKMLESNIIKKNDSVLITKKSILGTPKNSKQPPILNLGQGHGKRYSPNSKAYIVLNKETMKVEEYLNVKFDETPPPKSLPLVDDDILENDIIKDQDKDLEIKENEPLNKEIANIKSSKDHPLETVIGNLNERTLRSQVQNQRNFFYFVSSVKPKNIKEAIQDERTSHLGLWYPKGTGLETIVYADSDHAGDYIDRKRTSGVCTFVGCCLTSWFSKKQTALAISTTEAEYVSAKKTCQQALWMKQALADYDIKLDYIPVLCDNKGAIDLSRNPVLHSRTKHIEIRLHFLRDNVQKGNITIDKVNSEDNIADILTKPLKREPFNLLRLALGLMEPNT